jgi:hypothetical protein
MIFHCRPKRDLIADAPFDSGPGHAPELLFLSFSSAFYLFLFPGIHPSYPAVKPRVKGLVARGAHLLLIVALQKRNLIADIPFDAGLGHTRNGRQ